MNHRHFLRCSRRAIAAALLLLAAPLSHAQPNADAAKGTVVVSTRGDNAIAFISAATGEVQARIDAPAGAHEIAASLDGKIAVGSAYGSGPHHKKPDQRLIVIDVPARAIARTIDLGAANARPNDISFYPDHRHVLVTSEVARALVKVDAVEGKVVEVYPFNEVGGHMMDVSRDFTRAFVPSVPKGTLCVVDLSNNGALLATIPAGARAEDAAISPNGAQVWVGNHGEGTITVIDTAALKPIDTIKAAGAAFRIKFTPDGSRVVYSDPYRQAIVVRDAATRDEIAVIELATDALAAAPAAPTSIAISGDGSRLFAVVGPRRELVTIDLAQMSVVSRTATGPDPDGMAWSPGA